MEIIDFGIENPEYVYVVYENEIYISHYVMKSRGFYHLGQYEKCIEMGDSTPFLKKIFDKNTKHKLFYNNIVGEYHTYDDIMNEYKRIIRDKKIEELLK